MLNIDDYEKNNKLMYRIFDQEFIFVGLLNT